MSERERYDRPTLLLMKGLPGSGKSMIARELGVRLGWPVIDKDEILASLDPDDPQNGERAYQLLFTLAAAFLRQGFDVICDSPLTGVERYARACRIADDECAELRLLECCCNDNTLWRARLLTRRPDHARHITDPAELDRYLEVAMPLMDYPIEHPNLTIDTASAFDENIETAMRWLLSTWGEVS